MNCLAVLRGNTIEGDGGIWLGWYAQNIVVEANGLAGGNRGVFVANTTLGGIMVRNNLDNALA